MPQNNDENENLSPEEIKKFFGDIVDFDNNELIGAVHTCWGKSCGVGCLC